MPSNDALQQTGALLAPAADRGRCQLDMIWAGSVREATRDSGEWLFVDIGFSCEGASCGILFGEGKPAAVTFGGLREQVVGAAVRSDAPLNLVIEAPLSVAFNSRGNPTGRSIERQGTKTRYWYVGLGCAVLCAATYLLRSVVDAGAKREVRLFEGFVSFKPQRTRSSHVGDVQALRDVVWYPDQRRGVIVAPEQLAVKTTDTVCSAFKVAGLDLGIPPVITVALANPALQPTPARGRG